ncbi:TIGR01777 family oxidoreductase [Luteolibacter sp. AS25]|uniref:TIGR01777 family oxidoreductase n=1 Tax=Luteolibacter sp. AS25 TaxID=3135776 RepID=UPI00398B9D07
MSRKALLYGASGFVGSGLAKMLTGKGYEVIGVSRKGHGNVKGILSWVTPEQADMAGKDIIVNLAGSPIDQRWTEEKKKEFYTSRVDVTDEIVAKIAALPEGQRPRLLLNSSAVGYYGGRGDELITEGSTPGTGFLADLCVKWEEAARKAEPLGVRVVTVRTGVVLGKGGAAYEKLVTVFKMGIGGRLGDGEQWMPWIHIKDLRRAMIFAIETDAVTGPINGTAPNPERNIDLSQKLADAVNRWVFLPVPGFALKIALGEFAEFLLQGQKAIPSKIQDHGFEFKFAKLEDALHNLTASE